VEVLVTRRPAGVHLPGYWEFPGGKLEPREDPVAAVVREVAEETGIPIDGRSLKPLSPVRHEYPDRTVVIWPFIVEVDSGRQVQSGEIVEYRWISVPELVAIEFPPANAGITRAVAAYLSTMNAA
jgi:8-oxo-dGTP diphosphatase